jgi:hypothetical protein
MKIKGGNMNKKNIILSVLIASLLVLAFVGCVSTPTESGNVAKGKKAIASSSEPNMNPDNAVDGVMSTRWSTDWKKDKNPDAGFICVDLGSETKIKKVILNWEIAFGKEYTIDVSNDAATWKTLLTVEDGKAGATEFIMPDGTAARYLRMNGIKRGTKYGYSLFEFEIY